MNYKKLFKQPLKFVIAEFKFSPVLQIQKRIPDVQEAFRQKYPTLDRKTDRIIQFSDSMEITNIERWSFISGDKKQAIELNQGRMICFSSKYERFDGFSAACEEALNILSEIIQPSLIERVGLRYSDLVLLDNNEKMEDLINAHFICPKEISDLGSASQQKTELVVKTDKGQLAIRTLYGVNELSYLLDLQNRLPISILMENAPSERMILDFDHFWESEDSALNFNTENIMQTLGGLHATAREAFWKITTDYARNEKWA